MWPWLRWCSRYRYASQIVKLALEDVETMDPVLFAACFETNKEYDEETRHRSSARSAYIAHREKSHNDYLYKVEEVERYYAYFPLGHKIYEGRDFEQEVAYQWMRGQQMKAVCVLYAYGMFNKKTGQIELDNINKLR